ncbi:hypothetical protein NW754_004221 [Fusarium falciforme]|nr:hypothetical protein NW754_004221 [Fusarium falciforme]
MPSAKSFAVAALAASGVHAGAYDTGDLNCGIVGRDARDGLSDGDSTSLEDCAKSCIEDQGSDESCKLFEYTPDETDGVDVCKRYADYFFTTDETGSSRYYEPSCFECVRESPTLEVVEVEFEEEGVVCVGDRGFGDKMTLH